MGICFSYLGEFQPTKYREQVLSWMELFWTIGLLGLPCNYLNIFRLTSFLLTNEIVIAWMIIPLDVRIGYVKSWNLFVAISAIPSLVIGISLLTFPESPKFLVEVGEPDVALDILRDIFVQNTGNPHSDYPVMNIYQIVSLSLLKALKQVRSLRETEREYKFLGRHRSIRSLSIHRRKDLKILLKTFWHQTTELCKPPHLKLTLLTCFVQFGILTSYYTLMMWFPELFDRFEKFEKSNPNQTMSVCAVSGVVLEQT